MPVYPVGDCNSWVVLPIPPSLLCLAGGLRIPVAVGYGAIVAVPFNQSSSTLRHYAPWRSKMLRRLDSTQADRRNCRRCRTLTRERRRQ